MYVTCETVNLDYRSLAHHFECGTWMYKTECIKDMKQDYIDTINGSMEIKDAKNRLASWKKLIVEVMKVFFPLF